MADNALFEPTAGTPAAWPDNRLLAAPPSMADAYDYHAQALQKWMAEQRASGVAAGTNDPETGWPTQKGIVDAIGQAAQGVMMGTTTPIGRGAGGVPRLKRETISIAPTVDMRVNPSVPELGRMMDKHRGLRLIADGDNIAVAPAGDTIHDEMLSRLADAAHPLASAPDAWIAMHDGTVIDANNIRENVGGVPPEQWPLSLRLLFKKYGIAGLIAGGGAAAAGKEQ